MHIVLLFILHCFALLYSVLLHCCCSVHCDFAMCAFIVVVNDYCYYCVYLTFIVLLLLLLMGRYVRATLFAPFIPVLRVIGDDGPLWWLHLMTWGRHCAVWWRWCYWWYDVFICYDYYYFIRFTVCRASMGTLMMFRCVLRYVVWNVSLTVFDIVIALIYSTIRDINVVTLILIHCTYILLFNDIDIFIYWYRACFVYIYYDHALWRTCLVFIYYYLCMKWWWYDMMILLLL